MHLNVIRNGLHDAATGRGTLIAVCGEALVDLVGREGGAPDPRLGGGPFNTARALGRLGVGTLFVGHLSTDAYGRELAARLAGDRVDLSLATFGPEPTTVAVATLDSTGHATYEFVVEGSAAPNLTPAMLPPDLGPEIRALHIGSLGLVMEPIGSTLTQLAFRESRRRLIMLDPNVRPAAVVAAGSYRKRMESLISCSTIVKASETDLGWLFPGVGHEEAARLIVAQGARLAVVTLGERGAFGLSADARVSVAAPKVKVIDTIGAGDAFGAALLAWLHDRGSLSAELSLSPGDLTAALEFACNFAALTCTRHDSAP